MARNRSADGWWALGLLLAMLVLGYLLLVHWTWTKPMLGANERIETLQQREMRMRMYLEQAPQVASRLQQLQARQGQRPGFLPDANAQLATARLVQRLETVVAEASPGNRSCAITNRSPRPAQEQGSYTRVEVQVRLRCGTPELAAVLHSLEGGAPRLFVDNLDVISRRMYINGSGGQGSDDGLDVSLDLYGYLAPVPTGTTRGVTSAP